MSLVVVADLDSAHEAQLVRGMLRAHGIPAETTADDGVVPSVVTGTVTGTAVIVSATDAEDARALLADPAPAPDEPTDLWSQPGPAAPSPPGAGPAAPSSSRSGRPTPPPSSAPQDLAHDRPVAATRARRPRWVVVVVVLLLGLILWLIVQAVG